MDRGVLFNSDVEADVALAELGTRSRTPGRSADCTGFLASIHVEELSEIPEPAGLKTISKTLMGSHHGRRVIQTDSLVALEPTMRGLADGDGGARWESDARDLARALSRFPKVAGANTHDCGRILERKSVSKQIVVAPRVVRRTVRVSMTAPEATLIAGANGSGKTTFARQVLPLRHPSVRFLNADEIRHEDTRFHSDVAATRELLRRLGVAVLGRQSFAVETTLSSIDYVKKIRGWKTSGYRVCGLCGSAGRSSCCDGWSRYSRTGHPSPVRTWSRAARYGIQA
jgi:hypothetical protein